jgi:hypothetical protein
MLFAKPGYHSVESVAEKGRVIDAKGFVVEKEDLSSDE